MREQACEQLTLSAEDSPASHFPWLESRKVKKTTVTYGRKCSELSESLRRVGLSVRTYLESCDLPGERFVRTWSVRDTLSPFLILKLRLSELPIGESGSPLWLGTPTAYDYAGVRSERFKSKTPTVAEAAKMWPTPKARDFRSASGKEKRDSPDLNVAVRLFATPNASHAQGTSGGGQRTDLRTDAGGQLNPTWVEWLMGFPLGWTDLSA